MKLKALKSFAGKVSMYAGEVREIKDQAIVNDLLRAGYAEIEAQEAVVISKKETTTEKSSEVEPTEKTVEISTKTSTRKKKTKK